MPSRRHFLKLAASTAAVGVAPAVLASTGAQVLAPKPLKPVAPNDRIRLATIGMGIIGFYDTDAALAVPGTELVAVSDLYDGRLRRSQEVYGSHIATTRDYREILARPDVDAVIVSVPDHWHAQIAIDALEAGKHVYLEKPMVHTIAEGPAVIDAQRRTGKVLQVGSQSSSSLLYEKAKELFEAGAIGRLNLVEATSNRNSALGAWQYTIAPDASLQTIDWDRFLGKAPKRPFDPVRFFRWRNYGEYGTGVAGDLFVHLFTGLHKATSAKGPTDVVAHGGIRKWKDGRDAPDIILGLFEYPETPEHPEFTVSLQSNFADGSNGGSRFRLVGDEGAMDITGSSVKLVRRPMREPSEREIIEGYNSVNTFPKEIREKVAEIYRKEHAELEPAQLDQVEEFTVRQGYDARVDHFANFFGAARGGKPVVQDAVFGYRAAAPSLLANMSYADGKPFKWDPDGMRLIA